MIIEYSIALLEKLKLTPNEYFIVILLKKKEYDLITKFLKEAYTPDSAYKDLFMKLSNLGYLTKSSYIMNDYDFSNCKLSSTILSKIKPDDIFEEFLELYPKSVVRTDGTVDYLRTDQKQCRNLYNLLTKLELARHEHIVKCLKFEVDKRNRDGSIKFMVRMSKWLTTEAWKAYEDEINDSVNTEENKYGADVE